MIDVLELDELVLDEVLSLVSEVLELSVVSEVLIPRRFSRASASAAA